MPSITYKNTDEEITEMKKDLIFLLGAGASLDAGMPCTRQITSTIISGKNFQGEKAFRHSDETWSFGQGPSVPIDNVYMHRVLKAVKLLKYIYDKAFSDMRRDGNYEDIYFLAHTLFRAALDKHRIELQPFLASLYPELLPVLIKREDEIIDRFCQPEGLTDLFRETMNYIRDVVWYLLREQPTKIESLQSIIDACKDDSFNKVKLFTLNHDLVLEQALKLNSLEFAEGFEPARNKLRHWNPNLFDNNQYRILLFKIHGSINWFNFSDEEDTNVPDKIGIPETTDIWHLTNEYGHLQRPGNGRPVFLAGTENKIFSYSSGIFLGLISRFRESLNDVNSFAICGYSFGDKGINRLIKDWLFSNQENRLIVIDPSKELSIERASDIMARTTIIRKEISRVNYSEIRSALLAHEALK